MDGAHAPPKQGVGTAVNRARQASRPMPIRKFI